MHCGDASCHGQVQGTGVGARHQRAAFLEGGQLSEGGLADDVEREVSHRPGDSLVSDRSLAVPVSKI